AGRRAGAARAGPPGPGAGQVLPVGGRRRAGAGRVPRGAPVKPALYYPWVYLKGGAERVLAELMMRSRHDWTLYTTRVERDATFPELRHLKVVTLREIPVKRTIHHVAQAALTLLTQRLDLRGHDSLMVVSEGLGNLQASRSSLPTSCICLTPLKVTYDPV